MKRRKSIITSIIGIFLTLLAAVIILLVGFSSINTKNKMYEQMTTQGIQLGNQIRANLESEEAVYSGETLTSIGDNKTVESILNYLGTDDSIIYVGILDHEDKVIAHSSADRVGNVYAGTFENPTVQADESSASIYFDEESGNNALSLTMPIHNGSGNIIGVLALGFSILAVDAAIKTIIIQSILIGLGVFVLATILLRLYLGRLMKPIFKLKTATEEAAAGNLEIEPVEDNNNEIGELSNAFNTMISDIRAMIDKMVNNTDETNTTSDKLNEIASVSKDISDNLLRIINRLSDGADHQKVQSLVVQDNMGQMNDNISIIMSELNQFKEVMNDMITISKHSAEDMQFMDRQIEQIAETSKQSGDTVKELASSTDEISQIVDMINTIAKQTNLIALNAAIEAASAGEFGRGFSVVAEEIRKLANESLVAASKITEIVKENQNRSNDTITSIQLTIDQSDKGSDVAKQVKESFVKIQNAIDTAMQAFGTLEGSAVTLTESSEKITKSISQINSITQNVTESTNEATDWTAKQNASINEILDNVIVLEDIANSMVENVKKYKQ